MVSWYVLVFHHCGLISPHEEYLAWRLMNLHSWNRTLSRLTRKLFPEQVHTYSKLANQREIRVCLRRGAAAFHYVGFLNVWQRRVLQISYTPLFQARINVILSTIPFACFKVAGGRIRNCASLYRLIFLQSHDISFIDTEEQLDFCGEKKGNDWFERGKIIASSVVRTIVRVCGIAERVYAKKYILISRILVPQKNNKTMNQLTVVNSWKKC